MSTSQMWTSILKGTCNIKPFDIYSCNMEKRHQIQPSLSFESAYKSNPKLLDLSNKTIKQMDAMHNCVPGQFTKSDHLKAAYYMSTMSNDDLNRWNHFIDIQTECTVQWLQFQFHKASSSPTWNDNIWFNAQNERNNSLNSSICGVCDGDNWFKFVDALSIGPYVTHPWTPTLCALITKQIMKHLDVHKINILDVGCGVGEIGQKLNEFIDDHENVQWSIDGIDRSLNSLKRIKKVSKYRDILHIDLCNESEMNKLKKQKEKCYDVIASSDCLQMAYFDDLCPGSKAIQDLMGLVKENGYLLLMNTLQSPQTYIVSCIFDDILKEHWNEYGFECIADFVVRGYGDFVVDFENEFERNSVENNICFVKLMKRTEINQSN